MNKKINNKMNIVLFDVHVHIYDCFDMKLFFDSAIDNFTTEIYKNKISVQSPKILMLTDWAKENWFNYLINLISKKHNSPSNSVGNWSFHSTKENISLMARRDDNESLFIVAGRKIISEENLEVLALSTDLAIEDGLPLRIVIDRIRRNGAIPAIPWAVGKWMGKRGRVIRDLLEKTTETDLFLCDNGNRPIFWPRPSFFDLAEKKGIRVLSGSDPLHFASETNRVGSFANTILGTIDPDHPARDLNRILQNPKTCIRTYGKLEDPVRFFRNQLAMQFLKRKNRWQLVGS